MSAPHRSVREADAPGDCRAWSAPGAAAERAECRLRRHGYLALWHLSCEWAGGVLTLRDRLPTYYLKQVAQEAVAGVEGVERVVNEIEVTAPTGYGSPGSGGNGI